MTEANERNPLSKVEQDCYLVVNVGIKDVYSSRRLN